MKTTMFLPLLLLLFPAFLQGHCDDETCSPNIYTVLSELDAKVNKLENQLQVHQVAFSASLLVSGEETIGPYNDFVTLVYKNVVTNVGNAYNPNTGYFTAPVKGAYHFEFYIAVQGSRVTAAVLVKNGSRTFGAYENIGSGLGSASNGITLVLEVGDVVGVHLWENQVIYDSHEHLSTFSGRLLFTM
ncbi:complement C1q-like protein 4 [Sphaeramia orbicularis]|nr:complement C1q-like protein 4 [Sphaeramia orbicularis]